MNIIFTLPIKCTTMLYLVNRNYKNQFRILGINPRFKRFQNNVDENSELQTL